MREFNTARTFSGLRSVLNASERSRATLNSVVIQISTNTFLSNELEGDFGFPNSDGSMQSQIFSTIELLGQSNIVSHALNTTCSDTFTIDNCTRTQSSSGPVKQATFGYYDSANLAAFLDPTLQFGLFGSVGSLLVDGKKAFATGRATYNVSIRYRGSIADLPPPPPPPPAPAPVPLPAGGLMLFASLVGFGLVRRKAGRAPD